MIGREAYENPWSLTSFQAALLGRAPGPASRAEVVGAMADYAAAQMREGVPLRAISRHMLGLFNGLPGARAWRRRLAGAGPATGPSCCCGLQPRSGRCPPQQPCHGQRRLNGSLTARR